MSHRDYRWQGSIAHDHHQTVLYIASYPYGSSREKGRPRHKRIHFWNPTLSDSRIRKVKLFSKSSKKPLGAYEGPLSA
jgi:hypothetical protein